jgi:hypothetical protein
MKVRFIEEGHKYITDGGSYYTSVTTVLGKYKEPFDAEYWSRYKAIERLYTEFRGASYWNTFKRKGVKTVVARFKAVCNDTELQIATEYRKQILNEWEYEKNIACQNGTVFHLAQEEKWLSENDHRVEGVIYNTGNAWKDNDPIAIEDLPDGVYSELTLWNHYFEVAGQADIVYIETVNGKRYIDVDDYKTNKKIDEESFRNSRTGKYQMMQKPINNLMDCNRQHYELQISTYAYFLECFGYTVRGLNFQHHENIGTKEKPEYRFRKDYPLDYRKKEVVKMLKHFKKQ